MWTLSSDTPFGQPAFGLSADQIATVVDLTCCGVEKARSEVTPSMREVSITMIVRKAMRRVKATLALTNLEVHGEHELANMATKDATILGRIDITLKFLHQFGNEDAYVAIECKRVAAGSPDLNAMYVTQGVDRFVTGQYAAGHEWGFMLGYVLKPPVEQVVKAIDARIRNTYGEVGILSTEVRHTFSLAILEGTLSQNNAHMIQIKHIFVDMTPAAPPTRPSPT